MSCLVARWSEGANTPTSLQQSGPSHEVLKTRVSAQSVQTRIPAQRQRRERPFAVGLLEKVERFFLFAQPGINESFLKRRNILVPGKFIELSQSTFRISQLS